MEEEQELAITDALESVASRVTLVVHEVGAVKERGADPKNDVADVQERLDYANSQLEEVWSWLQKIEGKDGNG
jgi:hypothetical protein